MSNKVLIDTNLVLRLLLNDIPSQSKHASQVFKQAEKGVVRIVFSVMVINELVWILEKFYKLKRSEFVPELKLLFLLKGVTTHELSVGQLLEIIDEFEHSKLDWVDIYLRSISENSDYKLETFDKLLKKTVGSKK